MVGDISWVASRRITYHILQASWYHVTQTKELVAIFSTCCIFKVIASGQSETKEKKAERLKYHPVLHRIP